MPTTASSPSAPVAVPVPGAVSRALSALFDDAVAKHRSAGVTWAVVGGHGHVQPVLAHGAAGHHELHGGMPAAGSRPVGRDTISRIASMTKSFTAATMLALRDKGALRLDDPVAHHVPEAEGVFEAAPDAPVITVRHLLTMSAGLVTDNPWGDRQESLTREQFATVLRAGLGHVHQAGTGFEYSNTGYALLGRVIDEVTGVSYAEQIRQRFLEPLGMHETAFDPAELDRSRIATGHRVADRQDATRFEAEPFDAPGVYGAMAGLYSTVDDVAVWMRFLAAADAPDAAERDPARQSVLSSASRREMQQLHRLQPLPALPVGEDGTSAGFDRVRGYGYGLVIERFPDLGEVISHSGGYPGYGSFMVWHRDTGVGVVALGNSKYAPMVPLSMQALRTLLREAPQLLAPRGAQAAPRTLDAATAALDWMRHRTETLADAWFADTMDLDASRTERHRRLASALAAAGLDDSALAGLTPADAQVISRAQLRWTLPGAEKDSPSVRIDLQMDPRRDALIQGLDVKTVAAG